MEVQLRGRFRGFELANAAPRPGLLTAFRIVGRVYVVGNAIGILALKGKRRAWLAVRSWSR
ncbi:hypothetical protein UK23_05620 [Lentzea aerocolonigenes]|uniref:Uncharacterized protein n=1 Tax=Lentzea aerocolonigenes TaxID=68170 RepID=A0A0F0H7T7_LENAE|nr:hypothetical protein [Lentzea aerocolonigenes]KJK51789.1 hypothetical protein UK23_05620 [Lentzea aerocolonigenes]